MKSSAGPLAETWLVARGEAARQLAAAGIVTAEAEARFLVEEVSGYGPADWAGIADAPPSARQRDRLASLVERRIDGEPLQYVLGSWSFRGIDLMVDRRVLIPRPETEQVVEVAIEEAVRRGMRRAPRRHLSLVDAEPNLRPRVEVHEETRLVGRDAGRLLGVKDEPETARRAGQVLVA